MLTAQHPDLDEAFLLLLLLILNISRYIILAKYTYDSASFPITFANCMDKLSASRHVSSDLSAAKSFIALLNWDMSFLCSSLYSFIVFVNWSISSPELPNPELLNQFTMWEFFCRNHIKTCLLDYYCYTSTINNVFIYHFPTHLKHMVVDNKGKISYIQ